jgi:uracil-DNA glycosylase
MHASWKTKIPLIQNGYAEEIRQKVCELRKDRTVYPPDRQVFRALSLPFNKVRAVILGQDPYHGKGQAHGLAFSVPEGIKTPPSLRNIFKEIADDLGNPDILSRSTDLSDWAGQGVLLLNATLTVEEGKPGSHSSKGWGMLTDQILQTLSEELNNRVFMLWGAHAQAKQNLIDKDRHMVLSAAHPSPLSAYRGFFGCRHFSKANTYLEDHDLPPIAW